METLNVLSLAIEHGLNPVKVGNTHGGEYASPCPLCGGTDRFRIWPEQNDGRGSYWCRGCNAHGDRIQFVMDTRKVSFVEAARATGDDDKIKPEQKGAAGYQGPPDTPRVRSHESNHQPRTGSPATPPFDRSLWTDKAERLVTWSCARMAGSEGSTFLERRGMGAFVWEQYELGHIASDIYRPREAWGLETVMVPDTSGHGESAGAMRPKRLWIPAGIVIPHRCAKTGAVDRIRIRRPSGEPRYYVLPGSSSAQMALGLSMAQSVVVVESELDAILIDYLAGDITATIAMGSSHAKPDAATDAVLARSCCILVALDFDDAGKKACEWWMATYKQAIRWPVPDGKDPADAHTSGIDIREWVMAGWPHGMRLAASGAIRRAPKTTTSDTQGQAEQPDTVEIECPDPGMTGQRPPLDGPDESCSQSSADEIDPVEEVYVILRKNPGIHITATSDRLRLDAPEDWIRRNQSLFNRLSRMIFFDPEVFHWLDGHPDSDINRDNYFKRAG